jgi:hypothetical protein
MSKAVVYRGRVMGFGEGEWQDDEDVTDVTVADRVTEINTEIKLNAFRGCTGLTNLSFLEGSTITTVGHSAFSRSGIISLQGMEGVRKVDVALSAIARTCAPSRAWAARRWALTASPGAPCCGR